MNILVVGAGSIGRKHVRVLRDELPDVDITVFRPTARGVAALDVPGADRVVLDLDEALAQAPQAAVVASPASHHLEVASRLAEHGVQLLVEKPLATSADGAAQLVQHCRDRRVRLDVGYVLRFHPALAALRQAAAEDVGRVVAVHAQVGQHLGQWRPGSDPLEGVSARPELGGGALLELSHEIDYVRWICGAVEEMSAWIGTLSDLPLEVEDTADLRLHHRDGVVSQIHLDMVQVVPVRTCRVVGTTGTLELDLLAGTLRLLTPHDSRVLVDGPRGTASAFAAQLRHFLSTSSQRPAIGATGDDGLGVLRVVDAARKSHAARSATVPVADAAQ